MLFERSAAAGICSFVCSASLWAWFPRGPAPIAELPAKSATTCKSPVVSSATATMPTAPLARAWRPTVVVDVSSLASPHLIGELIRLDENERVTAIAEDPVENNIVAGIRILEEMKWRGTHAGSYLDLTIEGLAHQRRVLILFH